MSPTALTATMAPTMRPLGSTMAAAADPGFHGSAASAELADRRAGARADAAFRHRSLGGRLAPRDSRSRPRAESSDCRRLRGRTGSRRARSARGRRRRASRSALLEPPHDARRGIEAERAAAREHDGVDLVDHVQRIEQVGFPSAGGAAALGHAADRVAVDEHHRAAGRPFGQVWWPTLMPATAVSVDSCEAGLAVCADDAGRPGRDYIVRRTIQSPNSATSQRPTSRRSAFDTPVAGIVERHGERSRFMRSSCCRRARRVLVAGIRSCG